MRQRVVPLHARPHVEQQPQAGVIEGLGRVVDGLVVDPVRAHLEQQWVIRARGRRPPPRRAHRARRTPVLPARSGSAPHQRAARSRAAVGALTAEEGECAAYRRGSHSRAPAAGSPGRIARERRAGPAPPRRRGAHRAPRGRGRGRARAAPRRGRAAVERLRHRRARSGPLSITDRLRVTAAAADVRFLVVAASARGGVDDRRMRLLLLVIVAFTVTAPSAVRPRSSRPAA